MQRVNFVLALIACTLGVAAHWPEAPRASTATGFGGEATTDGRRIVPADLLEGSSATTNSVGNERGDGAPTLRSSSSLDASQDRTLAPLLAELSALRTVVQENSARQREIASVQASRETFFEGRSRRDLASFDKLSTVLGLDADQKEDIGDLLAVNGEAIERLRTLADRDGKSLKALAEALEKVDWEVDSVAAETAWTALEQRAQQFVPGTDEKLANAIRRHRKDAFDRIRESLSEAQQELWDKGHKGVLLPGSDESWLGDRGSPEETPHEG